ncbi:MAG: GFA family protein [Brevundimonas sp.]|uniref:GFA family protein n=1 Tax=Brevundimonas sp. TaxID=1871086 RepID=UPI0012009839|nr:GFA family protein [Brevundimonas sp.]RZJ16820.1 MAG: GFA family protein [Brevundimonas sp.]
MRALRHGGCHCGAVRFQCEIDLAPPGDRSPPPRPGVWWTRSFRCNCRFCMKTGFWKAFVPPEFFRVLQGCAELMDYRHDAGEIRNRFCRVCGVHAFAMASFEPMGGDFVAVNIACLDDVPPEELGRVPISYEDGLNDAWDRTPTVIRYL